MRIPYWALALPAAALYAFLMVGPLMQLLHQSLRAPDPARDLAWSLDAYRFLSTPSFLRTLVETVKTSTIAAFLSSTIGYLIAYKLVRHCGPRARNRWLGAIVSVLFLSLLIRIYAISLAFGSAGLMPYIARFLGFSPTSPAIVEAMVVLGLLNFTLPLAILSMLGVVENLNPKLNQAAQSLGASRYRAFLTIDTAICLPSLLSSAVLTFSLCISAFLVPMILGRGFIEFVSNLVYARFSELFDPATGAAMAITLLAVTLIIITSVQRLFRPRN